MPVLKLHLGDVVRTRKAHPCGGDQWEIMRLGADIGMRCRTCGRYVMMPRPKLERRIKEFVHRPQAAGSEVTGPHAPDPDVPHPGTGPAR